MAEEEPQKKPKPDPGWDNPAPSKPVKKGADVPYRKKK